MPDRDNWTAAMVLKWVLTRDLSTVFAMLESYRGVVIFSEDGEAPVVPEDVDAVMRAVDPTLPPGTRGFVLRTQRAIAAEDDIYRALRRGQLEVRARRNGTGDVETIAPNQWLALKFKSWNGHDLAVPIAIDQDILNLPQPIEDYLCGRVPDHARPAVWPDPLFAADQVTQVWPPQETQVWPPQEERQAAAAAEAPTQPGRNTVPRIPPERPDRVSNYAWQTYLSALEKGYDLDVRGSISKAARAIARDGGHHSEFQSERRALHRVLKALRKK